MSTYFLQNWQAFEQYLADTFGFRKTIKSGALFGDCDLYFDHENLKLRVEAKYSCDKKYTFDLKHFLKAKQQSKPGELVLLAYGVPSIAAKVLFFLEYTNKVAPYFLAKETTPMGNERYFHNLELRTIFEATDVEDNKHRFIYLDESTLKAFIRRITLGDI